MLFDGLHMTLSLYAFSDNPLEFMDCGEYSFDYEVFNVQPNQGDSLWRPKDFIPLSISTYL